MSNIHKWCVIQALLRVVFVSFGSCLLITTTYSTGHSRVIIVKWPFSKRALRTVYSTSPRSGSNSRTSTHQILSQFRRILRTTPRLVISSDHHSFLFHPPGCRVTALQPLMPLLGLFWNFGELLSQPHPHGPRGNAWRI